MLKICMPAKSTFFLKQDGSMKMMINPCFNIVYRLMYLKNYLIIVSEAR